MDNLKNFDGFINEGFSNAEIGIKDDAKDKIIEFLNRLLANEFVLFMKIWNFHWLVVSSVFGPIHGFFGDLYNKFFEIVDDTAERIRALGGRPIGTLEGFLDKTELKEYEDSKGVPGDKDMFEKLLEDYEFIIRGIRNFLADEDVDDGTENYLQDLVMKLEKSAWMIRSHIV